MSEIIETARQLLLQPADLQQNKLEHLMHRMLDQQIDYADLFFQYARHESWALEEGQVKSGSRNISQGVGVRAIQGEKSGFAYSDEIEITALERATSAARAIARSGGSVAATAIDWQPARTTPLYTKSDPIDSRDAADKVALLERMEAQARALDARVCQVMVSLAAVQDTVFIMRHDGRLAADIRPLVRLNVNVIVEEKGRREQGSYGGGGRNGYDMYFSAEDLPGQYVREAVRQALVNLEAVDSPAGTLPVVLASGWPGILLHEAIGHGLEGDFNRKGTSAFSNRMGESVATPACTVVDDGTLPGRRGSLTVDDEGTTTDKTVLIENGKLAGYMHDTMSARLMGQKPTGNGRRESYAHLPLPRMTNTYMLPGKHAAEEIIQSVDKGLYAVNFSGGQVDITSGKFVFSASEAYLIEKGKIGRPVRGATLIGNGPDVLTRVSMVGNDLQLDSGVGVCGKAGQSVPVGVGQPTLKIDALTIGGVEV